MILTLSPYCTFELTDIPQTYPWSLYWLLSARDICPDTPMSHSPTTLGLYFSRMIPDHPTLTHNNLILFILYSASLHCLSFLSWSVVLKSESSSESSGKLINNNFQNKRSGLWRCAFLTSSQVIWESRDHICSINISEPHRENAMEVIQLQAKECQWHKKLRGLEQILS